MELSKLAKKGRVNPNAESYSNPYNTHAQALDGLQQNGAACHGWNYAHMHNGWIVTRFDSSRPQESEARKLFVAKMAYQESPKCCALHHETPVLIQHFNITQFPSEVEVNLLHDDLCTSRLLYTLSDHARHLNTITS